MCKPERITTKKTLHEIFRLIMLVIMTSAVLGCTHEIIPMEKNKKPLEFQADIAMKYVQYQQELGPRTPNSTGHEKVINWIGETLLQNNCKVEKQVIEKDGFTITNIIGKKGYGEDPFYILGAHYDTRIYADHDPVFANRNKPVPGANDGASGVAVLLELCRVIPEDYPGEVWLVFFDAEDNGEIDDFQWSMGSSVFADEYLAGYTRIPKAVIVIDMIGDSDLDIYYERNSHLEISEQVWNIAEELGYSEFFIKQMKYRMMDDHIPFIRRGIPAIDIIDFDYPYWHTTEDTIDKISPKSLEVVGNTLLNYINLEQTEK